MLLPNPSFFSHWGFNADSNHVSTNSTEVICACVFVVQIYILTSYISDCPRTAIDVPGMLGIHQS